MKDVREYLHLYLGCHVQVVGSEWYESGTGKLVSIDIDGDVGVVSALTPRDQTKYCVEADLSDIKPILSSLSDMTEEDADDVWNMVEPNSILAIKTRTRVRKVVLAPERMKYLISRGYWLFGDEYFDKGLIINKKTLQV